jgi:hypothetical protein
VAELSVPRWVSFTEEIHLRGGPGELPSLVKTAVT